MERMDACQKYVVDCRLCLHAVAGNSVTVQSTLTFIQHNTIRCGRN